MKTTLIALSLIFTTSAFAQSNVMSKKFSKPIESSEQKGFYIGFDYMNLSDSKSEVTVKSPQAGSQSNTSQEGMHMGTAGLILGYNQTPEFGFGFDAGSKFLESFNRSEYGDMKVYFIIPEANLKFALHQYFYLYAGANVSFLTGSSAASRFKPDLGGQAGIGTRLTRNLAFNAGYTTLFQKYEDSDVNFEVNGQWRFSGFNSNLTYTF